MRDELREQGYDREEEYFKRKDKQLIDKLKKDKKELEREKKERDV